MYSTVDRLRSGERTGSFVQSRRVVIDRFVIFGLRFLAPAVEQSLLNVHSNARTLTTENNNMQFILDGVRAFLEQDRLTPLQNNIAVCFLSVVAFKLAQEFIAWLRMRFGVGVTYSKPALYMALSLGLLSWPLFDQSSWSWRLNTILPLAQLVQFVYKVSMITELSSLDDKRFLSGLI